MMFWPTAPIEKISSHTEHSFMELAYHTSFFYFILLLPNTSLQQSLQHAHDYIHYPTDKPDTSMVSNLNYNTTKLDNRDAI